MELIPVILCHELKKTLTNLMVIIYTPSILAFVYIIEDNLRLQGVFYGHERVFYRSHPDQYDGGPP